MRPKNVEKLIEVLIRLSYLAADYPEIEELDINPLIVTPEDVVALDARIVIDQDHLDDEISDYSHLILRPYPERLIKEAVLRDGTKVLLRPIKPEDEPMWLEMLSSCSKESIYSRFRHDFYFDSHEVATQFCYIDYDREIGIVAEIEIDGEKKLIGVGRIIGDPDVGGSGTAGSFANTHTNRFLRYSITSERKYFRSVPFISTLSICSIISSIFPSKTSSTIL